MKDIEKLTLRALVIKQAIESIYPDKNKDKYDVLSDKMCVCGDCKQHVHEIYLIRTPDERDLCPDCFLKEEKMKIADSFLRKVEMCA